MVVLGTGGNVAPIPPAGRVYQSKVWFGKAVARKGPPTGLGLVQYDVSLANGIGGCGSTVTCTGTRTPSQLDIGTAKHT